MQAQKPKALKPRVNSLDGLFAAIKQHDASRHSHPLCLQLNCRQMTVGVQDGALVLDGSVLSPFLQDALGQMLAVHSPIIGVASCTPH